MDESANLPNYMKSIQWFNCHKYDETKMTEAIKQIYQAFVAEYKLPRVVANGKKEQAQLEDSGVGVQPDYDVFISYAHKNKDIMTLLRNNLSSSLVVFMDSAELRTGNQWQQAIYESLERSTLVFALLSDDYFNSAVCREEFNLAIASVLSSKLII